MLFVFASARADGPDKEGRRGPLSWASLGTLPLALSNKLSEPAALDLRDHLYVAAKAALEVYRSVYSNQSAQQPL